MATVWDRRAVAARHEALHTVAARRCGHKVLEVHRNDDLSGMTYSGFSVDRTDRDYLIQRGVEKGVVLLLPFLDGAFENANQCAVDLRNVSELAQVGLPLDRIIDGARALLRDPKFQEDVHRPTLELLVYRRASGTRVDDVLREG
jgi:hypothetical protein